MKAFTSDITTELKSLESFLGGPQNLPATRFLRVDAEENQLRVSATDLVVGMQLEIPAQINETGSIVIPPSISHAVVGAKVVTLEEKNDNHLLISTETFKGKLNGLPINDYPELPDFGRLTAPFTIEAGALEQLLATAPFTAKKGRPVLEAVLLSWKQSGKGYKVSARAADGFMLAVTTVKASGKSEGKALVTRQGIAAILQLTKFVDSGDKIKVGLSGSHLVVKAKGVGVVWATQLSEIGKYPDLSQILNSTPDIVGTVDLGALIMALNQVAGISKASDSQNKNALFTFTKNHIVIAAEDDQIGSGAATVGFTAKKGNKVEKLFRVPTILAALVAFGKMVGNEEVTLSVPAKAEKPINIQAITDHGAAVSCVMPVGQAS